MRLEAERDSSSGDDADADADTAQVAQEVVLKDRWRGERGAAFFGF